MVPLGGLGRVVGGWCSKSTSTLPYGGNPYQVSWPSSWFPYVSFPLGVFCMTKYRSLILDLDYSLKLDNALGYKVLTLCTLLILGGLVRSVILEFRVM